MVPGNPVNPCNSSPTNDSGSRSCCNSSSTSSSSCPTKEPITACRCVEYFLPTEVAVHNRPDDCWVSYNGAVYDVTEVCQSWIDTREVKPLLAHAGKDISHWFDRETNDIKSYVHPVTGTRAPYCPHGPIPDVTRYLAPSIRWRPLKRCPWWLDRKYWRGNLTRNPRPCRIVNVLAGLKIVLTVCEEDTIRRIRERAFRFNDNGENYTWRFEGRDLDLDSTLTENGIPDERDRLVSCGLPDDYYIPSLMCYYNDPTLVCSNQA